jgi:hypothetical protein
MIYIVVYFDCGNWMQALSHHYSAESALAQRDLLSRHAATGSTYEVVVIPESEKHLADYAL